MVGKRSEPAEPDDAVGGRRHGDDWSIVSDKGFCRWAAGARLGGRSVTNCVRVDPRLALLKPDLYCYESGGHCIGGSTHGLDAAPSAASSQTRYGYRPSIGRGTGGAGGPGAGPMTPDWPEFVYRVKQGVRRRKFSRSLSSSLERNREEP